MYCVELRLDKPTLGLRLEEGRKKGVRVLKFEHFNITAQEGFKAIETHLAYQRDYAYQVSLANSNGPALAPQDQVEALIAHGWSKKTNLHKYMQPRPLRLWLARLSPRKNTHGHVQLIPPAKTEGDLLLVNILATEEDHHAYPMYTKGCIPGVYHEIKVHESSPPMAKGQCRQALLTLKPGQRVSLERRPDTQCHDRTVYVWQNPNLYMYTVRDQMIENEKNFHIPDLIAAEQAKDQAAYAAIAALSEKYEFIF